VRLVAIRVGVSDTAPYSNHTTELLNKERKGKGHTFVVDFFRNISHTCCLGEICTKNEVIIGIMESKTMSVGSNTYKEGIVIKAEAAINFDEFALGNLCSCFTTHGLMM